MVEPTRSPAISVRRTSQSKQHTPSEKPTLSPTISVFGKRRSSRRRVGGGLQAALSLRDQRKKDCYILPHLPVFVKRRRQGGCQNRHVQRPEPHEDVPPLVAATVYFVTSPTLRVLNTSKQSHNVQFNRRIPSHDVPAPKAGGRHHKSPRSFSANRRARSEYGSCATRSWALKPRSSLVYLSA